MAKRRPVGRFALLVVPVLVAALLVPGRATAAYSTAEQLACALSPASNTGYQTVWQQVSTNAAYQSMFWNDIVPNQDTACRKDVATTLWTRAVPGNWAPVADIGGWPWASGGYFTQTLWLHAVPDNWASVPNTGGWPWASGGYYTQYFWLHAVPDGVAPVADTGGWNAPTGGYYAQWLWLHAVPDNWRMVGNVGGWRWPAGGYYTQWTWLHAIADNWAVVPASSGWNASTGGYYRQYFWLHAVPENLRWVNNIGGWSWSSGGYYTQWTWLHAIPENWAMVKDLGTWPWATGGYFSQWFWLYAVPDKLAASPDHPSGYYTDVFWTAAAPQQWDRQANLAVGGAADSGYFFFWLYRFGTSYGIAPRATSALFGDAGVGYYPAALQGAHRTDPGIAPLWQLAAGYLPATSTARPVNQWYDARAHAVVIFSFDSEGDQNESCAIRDTLTRHRATATFFVVGGNAAALAPCLTGYDVQNHTADHPPATDAWATPGLFDTFSDAGQRTEIQQANTMIGAAMPGTRPTAFRTPWTDSAKSFDSQVAHNLLANGLTADSSVPLMMPAATTRTPLPPELRAFSVTGPGPFVARSENGTSLVEFPFAYPSDWEAGTNGLDENAADPTGTNTGTAVNLWKAVFDQIYAVNGTMVLLMHPWIQVDATNRAPALDDLLTYMQSRSGVYFSTMSDATARARAYYHW